MRKQLDEVDWEHLGAEKVPDMLLALLSDQKEVWEQAYTALIVDVVQVPQFEGYGTVRDFFLNELPILVTRFVNIILRSPTAPNKRYSLNILLNFCHYFSYGETTEPYKLRLDMLRQELASGMETYLSLITDAEEATRRNVTYLASHIGEHTEAYVKCLLERIPEEPSPALRMLSLWKIYEKLAADPVLQEKYQPTYVERLNDRLRNDESNKVRSVCAVCLVHIFKERSSPNIVTVVEETLVMLNDHESLVGYDWRYDMYRLTYTLTLLERAQGKNVLMKVIRDPQTPIVTVFYAVHAVLHLEFGTGHLPERYFYEYTFPTHRFAGALLPHDFVKPAITRLDTRQVALINEILKVARIFEVSTNVFGIHGLPDDYDSLVDLVK